MIGGEVPTFADEYADKYEFQEDISRAYATLAAVGVESRRDLLESVLRLKKEPSMLSLRYGAYLSVAPEQTNKIFGTVLETEVDMSTYIFSDVFQTMKSYKIPSWILKTGETMFPSGVLTLPSCCLQSFREIKINA